MTRTPTPHRRPEAGFSLLEVLIGGALLAIALLGHTASIFSEHNLSKAERARSTALLTAEQFMERMRYDDEWTTIYERLRNLMVFSRSTAATAYGGKDLVPTAALTEFASLSDGRRAFAPAAYYEDFVIPSSLMSFHVVVDVPAAPDMTDPTGPPVLREDLPLPRFGLPFDLNGDGDIDAASHNDDYIALPVKVTVRWTHTGGGEAVEELTVSSWLWGYR